VTALPSLSELRLHAGAWASDHLRARGFSVVITLFGKSSKRSRSPGVSGGGIWASCHRHLWAGIRARGSVPAEAKVPQLTAPASGGGGHLPVAAGMPLGSAGHGVSVAQWSSLHSSPSPATGLYALLPVKSNKDGMDFILGPPSFLPRRHGRGSRLRAARPCWRSPHASGHHVVRSQRRAGWEDLVAAGNGR